MIVCIVGSEGRWWIKEQEEKANQGLHEFFLWLNGAVYDKGPGVKTPLTSVGETLILKLAGIILGVKEITVASGECPKGKEQYWCLDHHLWTDNVSTVHLLCRKVKSYDEGGIDTWTKIIVHELGLPYKGYPPEVNQWEDFTTLTPLVTRYTLKGYKSRNLDMARDAFDSGGIVVVIEPTRTLKELKNMVLDAREMKRWRCVSESGFSSSDLMYRHSGGSWTADRFDDEIELQKALEPGRIRPKAIRIMVE